jgi:hypothetical protein
MCCGNGETHQEAPDALSTRGTWGIARQKPGRVVVRHFCHWPLYCNKGRPGPRPLSHRSSGNGAITRQIARGSGRCRARNSANTRRTCEGIRIVAAQQHRSCRGDRGFWLELPGTSLARSSQLRGRSGEPGGKG